MKIILLIAITLVTSACDPVYIHAPLPMPQKVDLPGITNDELQCVSSDTYRRLAKRDLAHKQYEARLEAVIRSTWRDDDRI